jgi:hypothetical protein
LLSKEYLSSEDIFWYWAAWTCDKFACGWIKEFWDYFRLLLTGSEVNLLLSKLHRPFVSTSVLDCWLLDDVADEMDCWSEDCTKFDLDLSRFTDFSNKFCVSSVVELTIALVAPVLLNVLTDLFDL